MTKATLRHPVYPLDLLSAKGLKVSPHPDRVFVAKLPKDRLADNPGGVLFIPATAGRRAQVRNNWGQVLAVGEGVRELKPGDIVHWDDHAGMVGEVKAESDFDSHVDLSDSSDWHSFANTLPQDRSFAFLAEDEIDIALDLEEGDELPFLHDA